MPQAAPDCVETELFVRWEAQPFLHCDKVLEKHKKGHDLPHDVGL